MGITMTLLLKRANLVLANIQVVLFAELLALLAPSACQAVCPQ
jgi:hypothetical protein